MTNDSLNRYIYHYLTSDKTNSAIMLTGKWGTGKSYYIQNELIPYIKSNTVTEKAKQCIVVSLYGMRDVRDISKMIYIDLRFSFLPKGEVVESGKVLGKTIFKGVTSFFGIDMNPKEEDLDNLYKSIDLSGKLIILEDLERSSISVTDVLGYVNNLVEQDGVKILIVANEEEILKYTISEPDKDGKTYKVPDKNTIEYLKTKEKTISDTITYDGDYPQAIKNIISLFKNPTLQTFATDEGIESIQHIMILRGQNNLRSFVFACQKTVDIIDYIGAEKIKGKPREFIDSMFYGTVAFVLQYKTGGSTKWGKGGLLSTELGLKPYPLFRFSYDYILFQSFEPDLFERTSEEFDKYRMYDIYGSRGDTDIDVVLNYAYNSEEAVLSALQNVEERLTHSDSIPYYDYGKLIPCFVRCHFLLGFDYSSCMKSMAENLSGKGDEIDTHILFLSTESTDKKEQELIDEFILEINNSLNKLNTNDHGFTYKPEDLEAFSEATCKQRDIVRGNHRFISSFDIKSVMKLLSKCNSEQLSIFRRMIRVIYKDATRGSFIEDDCAFFSSMIVEYEKLEKSEDRIILWQRQVLKEEIQSIIERLT